jgi:hypothetical protein
VKRTFFTVIICLAAIAFLALYLADREIQAGIRRLSNYHFPPHSALEADPDLWFVTNHIRPATPPAPICQYAATHPSPAAVGPP